MEDCRDEVVGLGRTRNNGGALHVEVERIVALFAGAFNVLADDVSFELEEFFAVTQRRDSYVVSRDRAGDIVLVPCARDVPGINLEFDAGGGTKFPKTKHVKVPSTGKIGCVHKQRQAEQQKESEHSLQYRRKRGRFGARCRFIGTRRACKDRMQFFLYSFAPQSGLDL